ncbi:MAG: glutathione S-transferase family protein [Chthoniobacter sp.]|uniref:glutathione S-transferase family protein n=1 Tax=Chthoniobacter sp. TaxID=2510640 RepID=UPI0032A3FCF1
MSLTIYEMAYSPFCIPITAALRACGVDFERREIPNWDRSELLRLTNGAYYQVPVLVHDGRIVTESSGQSEDIAHYVDQHFAGGRLFPERLDGLQQIVIEFLSDDVEFNTFRLLDPHTLDHIGDPVARGLFLRHKERKFGRGCVEQWRREAPAIRAEADRLLARFETTLRHSPFLFGAAPVYSDFLLYGMLGNLTYGGHNRLNPEQDALSKWFEKMGKVSFSAGA